jgi:hypothetical protein
MQVVGESAPEVTRRWKFATPPLIDSIPNDRPQPAVHAFPAFAGKPMKRHTVTGHRRRKLSAIRQCDGSRTQAASRTGRGSSPTAHISTMSRTRRYPSASNPARDQAGFVQVGLRTLSGAFFEVFRAFSGISADMEMMRGCFGSNQMAAPPRCNMKKCVPHVTLLLIHKGFADRNGGVA